MQLHLCCVSWLLTWITVTHFRWKFFTALPPFVTFFSLFVCSPRQFHCVIRRDLDFGVLLPCLTNTRHNAQPSLFSFCRVICPFFTGSSWADLPLPWMLYLKDFLFPIFGFRDSALILGNKITTPSDKNPHLKLILISPHFSSYSCF